MARVYWKPAVVSKRTNSLICTKKAHKAHDKARLSWCNIALRFVLDAQTARMGLDTLCDKKSADSATHAHTLMGSKDPFFSPSKNHSPSYPAKTAQTPRQTTDYHH